jgi:hypothetical protein
MSLASRLCFLGKNRRRGDAKHPGSGSTDGTWPADPLLILLYYFAFLAESTIFDKSRISIFMERELIDRAEAIHQRVLQLRDSL